MSKDKVFESICGDMLSIYKAKNADYGDSFSCMFMEYGMVYPIMHLQEKLERIKSLQKKSNEVEGETLADSLYDLANYAIMTLIELKLVESPKG